jgi:putative membrane protein insertion efficiency factor
MSLPMKQVVKIVVLGLLRAYKRMLSPMFPPACRYLPTCSEYAIEAVQRFGALRGSLMAAGRVLRCHPFVKGGYDPVGSERGPEVGGPAALEPPGLRPMER